MYKSQDSDEHAENEWFSFFFEKPQNHIKPEEQDYYEAILEQQIELDNNLSYNQAMKHISNLKKQLILERLKPSDLLQLNDYTDFLFHRNLVTDKKLQSELDENFAVAFAGRKEAISIS